jgi:hypothetical protein
LYARSLPGNCACTASANCAASSRSGVEVSHQRTSAYGAYASARDRRLDTRLETEEALGRPLAGDELAVALVDIAREQRRRERVGARDEDGRHVEHVRREPGRHERADELTRRHEHLSAQVAALLLGRELVLEVDARGTRLDERLHELERVERPAEARLRVRDDRREPVRPVAALRRLDLVGAQEGAVDALHEGRGAVRRIEALVRVGLAGEVRVGRDLPAGEVDRLQAGLHHLHGLRAGERAEGGDVLLLVHELPQTLGTEPRDRVLHVEPSADPLDVLVRVRPLDTSEPRALVCAHRHPPQIDCVQSVPGLDPKYAVRRRQPLFIGDIGSEDT